MAFVKLIETIHKTILRQNLLPLADSTLVVGVSGGTDSLALLHSLVGLRHEPTFSRLRLHVATLDHGLRGEDGAADARFVVETAQAWGVPVTAGMADVGALAAERGIGIEAAARISRYDFLASVAREVGAERVAVAHNADDQVETVLLHLLRGSGIGGLAGMSHAAPLPGHPDLTLIRPLLGVPRADLDAYCRENGLTPRQDATNEDTSYTRNRLRREALPYLRTLSPQIDRSLMQLAQIAALEDDFADEALHAAVKTHVVKRSMQVALPREVFVTLHPVLQRRFVVWAARELGAEDFGYQRVTGAVSLALEGEVGKRLQLRDGVQLRVAYADIVFELDNRRLTDDFTEFLLVPTEPVPVAIPGSTPINAQWSLVASLEPLDDPDIRLAIPESAQVVLRGRRDGDRYAPLGLNGHIQKVSKWMVDHKVPRDVRDFVPLLIVNGDVAAIYWNSWTISESFAVKPGSSRIVYFLLSRK